MKCDTRHFAGLVTQLLLLVVGFGVAAAEDREGAPHWISVHRPPAQELIQPLIDLRRSQGYEIAEVVVQKETTPAEIRSRIEALEPDAKSVVVLVGAYVGEDPEWLIPAFSGTVQRMKDQPTDNGYGLPGESLMPRLAVGRLPVRDAEELRSLVDKILKFERDSRPGAWRRRFVLFAGAPAFNPFVDQMLERAALGKIGQLGAEWLANAIYFSPSSPYTIPYITLRGRAQQYLGLGQSLVIFLGHSSAQGFWWGQHQDKTSITFGNALRGKHWREIPMGPTGLFASFGCEGAQLGPLRNEGYVVHSMRNPRGPVAAIGSHGICWAAMSLLMAEGLINVPFDQPGTLTMGDIWLSTKRNLDRGEIPQLLYMALNQVDGDTGTPQPIQRREHQEMFLLLGDPATRFPQAIPLKFTASWTGESLKIEGQLPEHWSTAVGRLALVRPLSQSPGGLEAIPEKASAEVKHATLIKNHQRANAIVKFEREIDIESNRIELSLDWHGAPPSGVVQLILIGEGQQTAIGAVGLAQNSSED